MTVTKRLETNAILLLGSEPVVRLVMTEALQQAGYVVQSTGSLGTAVDMLADVKFGLLIIPPYIDNISGHEAAKYLRARNPRMGILMVGGLMDDDRIRYRAKLEGFEIFPPLFSASDLLAKVDEVMKSAQERAAHGAGPHPSPHPSGHPPSGR
jgi:DNA-binding NtrC family response regulator